MQSMSKRFLIATVLASFLSLGLAFAPASADVVNGDFSAGGADWSDTADPGFSVSYPALGGNPGGYALLESFVPNPGGRACTSQTFDCGQVGGGTECTIGFEYMLTPLDAAPGSGRIVITIDGVDQVVDDQPTSGWTFVSYVVPCGTHTVEICLEVDPADNVWQASIDNVRSECTGVVGTEESTWSSVKARY